MNVLSVAFALCVILSGMFNVTNIQTITVLAGLWILVYGSFEE